MKSVWRDTDPRSLEARRGIERENQGIKICLPLPLPKPKYLLSPHLPYLCPSNFLLYSSALLNSLSSSLFLPQRKANKAKAKHKANTKRKQSESKPKWEIK
jgi:hypothetical protein